MGGLVRRARPARGRTFRHAWLLLTCLPAVACHGGSGEAAVRSETRDSVAIRFQGRVRGSAEAPVTLYEFSDFQCPYCRSFADETFPLLDSLYIRPGRVRWVFVNHPKPNSHANAVRSAEAAMCAAMQDRFWPMHDVLFSEQARWAAEEAPDEVFAALASSQRLDLSRFRACLAGSESARDVDADRAYAASLGIGGVPAFVVDGVMVLQGARPAEQFRAVLDSLLAVRPTLRSRGTTPAVAGDTCGNAAPAGGTGRIVPCAAR